MKILLVHNYYKYSGGERVALENQVSLLRSRGHSIITYTKDNDTIDEFSINKKVTLPLESLFSRETYKQIKTLVKNEQPDIAHVHNVFPLISPAIYYGLKDSNIPIVQTLHNFRFLCPNALFYTRDQICERCKCGNTFNAVRFKCYKESYALSALYASIIGLHRKLNTFNLIDRYIALTEFTRQKVIESNLACPADISVLGNFLPEPLPRPGLFDAKNPYLLFLGRLSKEKGLELLLEAMAELPQQRLMIAGEGPESRALQDKVAHQKLTNIEFLGYVAGRKKWKLLREAMANIIPSIWYEHCPFSILESWAVGTPVIASNIGSLSHIVEHEKNGLLFDLDRPPDLRNKISSLANDTKAILSFGEAGRQMVETRYSAKAHYDVLISIYENVLS